MTQPAASLPPSPAEPPPSSSANVQRPADFDAFWEETLREVNRIPLNATIEPNPLRSSEDVETFNVHYDSLGGVRIAAWFCIPRRRGAESGALPGLVSTPGYITDPIVPKDWAAKGYATIAPAPRGKVRSRTQFDPGYPGLLTHNIVDRHTYAYRGFFVDALRAVDFLKSQPLVDPERVGVAGASQGGALALVLSALRPREIRCAAAGVPYLCDYLGALELTRTYPYHEITDYLRLYPERRDAVVQTLAYFDGLNFAPRIECPIIVSLGLQDNVVPPETCRAVYDRIGSPNKRLYCYPECGHDGGAARGYAAVLDAFLSEHLQP